MKKTKNSLEELKVAIEQHKPLLVNYGKGYFTDKDILDHATWDESIGKYRDDTGIWDTKLLLEIAQGKVDDTTLELEE